MFKDYLIRPKFLYLKQVMWHCRFSCSLQCLHALADCCLWFCRCCSPTHLPTRLPAIATGGLCTWVSAIRMVGCYGCFLSGSFPITAFIKRISICLSVSLFLPSWLSLCIYSHLLSPWLSDKVKLKKKTKQCLICLIIMASCGSLKLENHWVHYH